jgi:predicted nuclease of predicted toxin-antitoxin system
MKFLMDENVEPAITEGLRTKRPDLDIVTVQEVGLRTQDDEAVLAWAAEAGRIVVSHDRATLGVEAAKRIVAQQGMPGVLLIRPGVSYGDIIRDLELIAECAEASEFEHVIDFFPY